VWGWDKCCGIGWGWGESVQTRKGGGDKCLGVEWGQNVPVSLSTTDSNTLSTFKQIYFTFSMFVLSD